MNNKKKIPFIELMNELHRNLKGDYNIRPGNVYIEGHAQNRELIGKMVDKYLLPGSQIVNSKAFQQLYDLAQQGKSVILFVEHYSNLDWPGLFRLAQNDPLLGDKIASKMVPIQGIKLSHNQETTGAFSNSYDTLVIYPSRSISQITDPEALAQEKQKRVAINRSAIKELIKKKHEGRIILVFPSGTRYRDSDPSTKKGVREVDSYMKIFDYCLFISINGNCLPISEEDVMEFDAPEKDVLLYSCSDVISAKQFRSQALEEKPEGEEPKQYVADKIMEKLEELHQKSKPLYQKLKREAEELLPS